jgi:hypothetical protein
MANCPFMGITFPIIGEAGDQNGQMPYFMRHEIWHLAHG